MYESLGNVKVRKKTFKKSNSGFIEKFREHLKN